MSQPVIVHLLSTLTEGGTDILGKTLFSYMVHRPVRPARAFYNAKRFSLIIFPVEGAETA